MKKSRVLDKWIWMKTYLKRNEKGAIDIHVTTLFYLFIGILSVIAAVVLFGMVTTYYNLSNIAHDDIYEIMTVNNGLPDEDIQYYTDKLMENNRCAAVTIEGTAPGVNYGDEMTATVTCDYKYLSFGNLFESEELTLSMSATISPRALGIVR